MDDREYDLMIQNAIRYDDALIELSFAKSRIEQLEAALREINKRLNDGDSWLAQSIDCRNIAEAALGEKR